MQAVSRLFFLLEKERDKEGDIENEKQKEGERKRDEITNVSFDDGKYMQHFMQSRNFFVRTKWNSCIAVKAKRKPSDMLASSAF